MAEHRDLTDTDGLHEPKGISSATAGQVYVADGAGGGTWMDSLEQNVNHLEADFLASSAIPVAAADTPIKISSTYGAWTVDDSTGDISIDTDGKLTFGSDGWYEFSLSARFYPDANLGAVNETNALKVFINGVEPPDVNKASIQYTLLRDSLAGDRDNVYFYRTRYFTAGDYIELYHVALDNTSDIWYERITVVAKKFGV